MRIDKKLAYPANLIRALKTYEIYYRFISRLPDLSESMILGYLENYTAYLTERERAVLKLRFEDKLSLKDAGKKLPDLSPHFKEVSGGRITQIEEKAIGKLRRHIIRCEDKKAIENKIKDMEVYVVTYEYHDPDYPEDAYRTVVGVAYSIDLAIELIKNDLAKDGEDDTIEDYDKIDGLNGITFYSQTVNYSINKYSVFR